MEKQNIKKQELSVGERIIKWFQNLPHAILENIQENMSSYAGEANFVRTGVDPMTVNPMGDTLGVEEEKK